MPVMPAMSPSFVTQIRRSQTRHAQTRQQSDTKSGNLTIPPMEPHLTSSTTDHTDLK